MSETQFTKGIWMVQNTENLSGRNVWEVLTDSYDVCSCDLSIRNKHDAELIACAPEMYEMLEDCEILLTEGTQEHCEALAGLVKGLLAKARGDV